MGLPSLLAACVDFLKGKTSEKKASVNEVPLAPSVPSETPIEQNLPLAINPTTDQPKTVNPDLPLPDWFQGEILTELLRLARAHCEERVHRQILADWVERYAGQEGQLLCRFLRRDEVLRHDASTWQTLSASEARLVAPFSDLVLGIGDRVVLPLTETQNISMGWVPAGDSWLEGGDGKEGTRPFTLKKGLWCGSDLVTQDEWQAVMGYNPSYFQDNPKKPVDQVSWIDVQVFLKKINANSSEIGYLYRLPTADEWEYIKRGGPLSKKQSEYFFYFARSETDFTPAPAHLDFLLDWPTVNLNKTGIIIDREYENEIMCNLSINPLGMRNMQGITWEWSSTVGVCKTIYRTYDKYGYWDVHGGVFECSLTVGESAPVFCGCMCDEDGNWFSASHSMVNTPGSRHSSLGFRLLAVPVGRVGQVDS